MRYLVAEKAYAERRACELVGIARSTYRYQRRIPADEADLRARIRALANEREAYGYRMIANLLQREGWQINVKRVHRLWKEEGLQQPRRRPRRRYAQRAGTERRGQTTSSVSEPRLELRFRRRSDDPG